MQTLGLKLVLTWFDSGTGFPSLQGRKLSLPSTLRKRTCDLSRLAVLHEHALAPEIPGGLPNCEEL